MHIMYLSKERQSLLTSKQCSLCLDRPTSNTVLECIYECIKAVSSNIFCIFEYFSCVLCKDDKLSSIQCFCVYGMPEKYNLVFLISSNKDLWQQMYLPHPTQKGIDFTFHILEEGRWQNGPSC